MSENGIGTFIQKHWATVIVLIMVALVGLIWPAIDFVYRQRIEAKNDKIDSQADSISHLVGQTANLEKTRDSLFKENSKLKQSLAQIYSKEILKPTFLECNISKELLQGELIAKLECTIWDDSTYNMQLIFGTLKEGKGWAEQLAKFVPFVGAQYPLKFREYNLMINILEVGKSDGKLGIKLAVRRR